MNATGGMAVEMQTLNVLRVQFPLQIPSVSLELGLKCSLIDILWFTLEWDFSDLAWSDLWIQRGLCNNKF